MWPIFHKASGLKFSYMTYRSSSLAQNIVLTNIYSVPISSSSNTTGPRCTTPTVDGNFAINGNYYGNLNFDWLLSPVAVVVAIDGKVTTNDEFLCNGAHVYFLLT